jgi:Tfp pilus assembly protein PilF
MRKVILISLILFPNLLFSQKLIHQESTLAADSIKVKYYFHEALRNKFMQNFGVSYELLKQCVKIDKNNPDYFYELSIVSFSLDKKEESVKYASFAYYGDTSNKYFALQYAQVLNLTGKNLEAVWVYKKILDSNNASLEDYLNCAFLYQKIGDLDNALKLLIDAETLFGVQDIISGSKIDIYTRQKRFDEAISEGQKLVNQDSLDFRKRLVLYDAYLAGGDIASAELLLKNSYKLDNSNTLLLLNLSNFYLVTGNTDLYFKYLNRLIFLNGNIEDIYQLVAKLLSNPQVAIQNIVSLVESLDSLKQKYGNQPLISDLESQVNIFKGNYSMALKNLNNVIQSSYSSETIWERYLSLELQLQLHDSINAITDSLITAFPSNPFIPFVKAISLWQQGKPDLAIEILKKYSSRIANRQSLASDYFSTMGDIYHELGKEKLAYKMYDAVLAINSKNLPVLNNYSYFLSVENKRLDDALRMSRITIDLQPTNATYLDTYGWILFKLRRFNEAESFIRQAIVNGSDSNPEVLEHYGDVLFELNRVTDAMTYWKMSLQLEPNRKGLKEKILRKRL